MKAYKLFLLNLIPVVLVSFLPLGALSLFVFVYINLKYAEKFWIALLAIIMSSGLGVLLLYVDIQISYNFFSPYSETLLFGKIAIIVTGIIGAISVFAVILAGLLSER